MYGVCVGGIRDVPYGVHTVFPTEEQSTRACMYGCRRLLAVQCTYMEELRNEASRNDDTAEIDVVFCFSNFVFNKSLTLEGLTGLRTLRTLRGPTQGH